VQACCAPRLPVPANVVIPEQQGRHLHHHQRHLPEPWRRVEYVLVLRRPGELLRPGYLCALFCRFRNLDLVTYGLVLLALEALYQPAPLPDCWQLS